MKSIIENGRCIGGVLNSSTKQGKIRLSGIVIVAFLVGTAFWTGKYIEFNNPSPWDGAAFVYSAQHVLNGARIGVEEKPTALVGTLLVNMLGVWLFGFNEVGPKLLQTALQIIALAMMFFAMRKLFGTVASVVSVITAAVYLSTPMFAKDSLKEQYMTDFMIIGMSCFVLWKLGGRWWWCVLAGAFVAWGPLFKATGISAIVAIGLFLIVQPLLRHQTWKQTRRDVFLLLLGMGMSLAPVYIWLVGLNAPKGYWPYSFARKFLIQSEEPKFGSYIANSREIYPFAKQLPKVLRYYRKLRLPIVLAVAAIIARLIRLNWNRWRWSKQPRKTVYERFVLLFAVWWVLDMAFVWISPRSYGHYYLPLNASATMLSGYIVALYRDRIASDKKRAVGIAGIVFMLIMSWSIFKNYIQNYQEVVNIHRNNLKDSWQVVGEYIRRNSKKDDKIYVWGWVPGIYVEAQRFSAVPQASTGGMHIMSPEKLSRTVVGILTIFEKEKPKFIVDTHKIHFPWDRPPLELWPKSPKPFKPTERKELTEYETTYSELLAQKFGQDEALRYKAMAPLRDFVMQNYVIVAGPFGKHNVFELKKR